MSCKIPLIGHILYHVYGMIRLKTIKNEFIEFKDELL
jgi:hypothetical protein